MKFKKIFRKFCRCKKAMEMNLAAWIILGIIFLVISIVIIILLRSKGIGALDFIKDLFRFGGK